MSPRQWRQSLSGAGVPGKIYELGGPEALSFRDLLDRTQAYADRSRAYFPIPFLRGQADGGVDVAAAQWSTPVHV